MQNVIGIIFVAIGIIVVIWIFFFRNTGEEHKPPKKTTVKPPDFTTKLKEILGPDVEDEHIKLVWDTFLEHPEDPDYYVLIVGRLMSMKKYEKARKYLLEAIPNIEPDAEIYETLGDICLKLGKLDEAVDAYDNAIKIDPEHTKAMVNLATVYISKEEYDTAKEILLNVLKENYDDKRARFFYGQALYENGEYEEAFCELNKVYKSDQRIPQIYFFIGMVLMKLGEETPGRKMLKKYLQLQPEGAYSIEAQRVLAKPEIQKEDLNETEE
ncbi:MAG: tetratricopeptide repeat protein [Candidatus Zixiibacteriota bacterium]